MSNLKIKTHYSAMEIASFKLNSAPHAHKNVQEKAKRECWTARKREGRGGGLEYAFESLPQEIQAEILLKHTESKGFTEPTRGVAHKNYLPEVIWAPFDKASEKQRAEAQQKLVLLHKIDDLTRNNIKLMDALEMVATEFNVAKGSLKRWYYKVRTFERSDWLPLLLDKHGTNRKSAEAEFTPEAWESFKADYFRNERPQFGSCYERLKRAAREQGWVIPSASSVKRKIEREIPKVQQVFLRNGEHALSQYYPTMQRSVVDLEALEWINGDGYQHNVFVEWHNGDIVRPKTWIWQDIRTRKILAYRVDLSENSDTIRLSLMDLIWKYGIPKKCTIDNTRAAANKWMTGGVKNRYRFKVKEDDVKGIIPLLGIELLWTSIQFGKGHGQAKPVERAFSHGGLGELVDKHPKLAGFYAGENIYNKPDNYNGGKAGVDYDTFILALEDGIRTFNEREGRETEICQGVYRKRILAAPEAFSTCGSVAAYDYHVRAVSQAIADVNVATPKGGLVRITVLTKEGIPDSRLLNDIKQYVSGEKRRPLCDTVEVKAPTQRDYQITASLKLLDGFREDIVKTKARDALQFYLSDKTKKLGLDVVPSALISALRVEGVYDVTLTSPQKIVVAENEWANCTAISVEVESERTNG